jgi:cytochrome b subunit of formate dehydrogenase
MRTMMVRGPTEEEYEKFTHGQKTTYWLCVVIIFTILGGLAIKKFFF